jgi:hypothetical protein
MPDPGVPGLIASVPPGLLTRGVDPSVGGSGPHDLAVRETCFRRRAQCALSILASTAPRSQRP